MGYTKIIKIVVCRPRPKLILLVNLGSYLLCELMLRLLAPRTEVICRQSMIDTSLLW